jgi:uncharacterized membrane protein YuzA (DUF378 family)
MRRILLSIAVIPTLLVPIIFMTQTSHAVNINPAYGNNINSICDKVSGSAYCQDANNPTNRIYGKDGVIVTTSYIIAGIAGVAAIIMIVIGGIRFMVSGGDPSSVASARNSIIFALVGLVVIAAAESIFLFVIHTVVN